jgi:hypothetical protein
MACHLLSSIAAALPLEAPFFLVKNGTKRYIQGGKTVLYSAKYNARLALVWPGNQSPGSSDT